MSADDSNGKQSLGSTVLQLWALHTLLSDSSQVEFYRYGPELEDVVFKLNRKDKFEKDEKMRVMMMIASYHLLKVVQCY